MSVSIKYSNYKIKFNNSSNILVIGNQPPVKYSLLIPDNRFLNHITKLDEYIYTKFTPTLATHTKN